MPALTKKKNKEINLLPVDPFLSSVFGRSIQWMLSTFRILVILVEMVVMTAFLSRFWLDAKNSDLSDEIKQKQALLESSKKFEQEYKNIQEKLNIYASLVEMNTPIVTTTSLLPNLIPTEISLDIASISSTGVNISGSSPSEVLIAQLVSNIANRKEFEDVSLSSITVDEETGYYNFKLSFSTVNKKEAKN